MALLTLVGTDGLRAQGPASEPPVQLTKVHACEKAAAPETLCQLSVEIVNRGELPVYSLVFRVAVEGVDLPVYAKQVFMVEVPPVADDEPAPFTLPLFNFWTSETGRPAPADGKLDVVVELTEAQWLEVREEKADSKDPVVVWSSAGKVPGLPSEARTSVRLTKRSSAEG